MQRREFLAASAATAATAAALTANTLHADEQATDSQDKFQLQYAPHFNMFRQSAGEDFVDQLKFAADHGFTAWEDNGLKQRSVEDQNRIAKTMDELGMQMGVFVATATFAEVTFAGDNQATRDAVLKDVRDSIEVAKRVNATWMTVVLGRYDEKLAWDYQTANAVELLRRCCDILEPHGLVMVLEPLNRHTNHPGVFLAESPHAYAICKAVNSPSCKILFDIYHQQITEGNLLPNIDRCWDEAPYFQIGDNPGRKEPGTGEINYRNIFKHIHGKGFKGVLGMEHGNSQPGREGEMAVIKAYREADQF